jgi:hypothetical protein
VLTLFHKKKYIGTGEALQVYSTSISISTSTIGSETVNRHCPRKTCSLRGVASSGALRNPSTNLFGVGAGDLFSTNINNNMYRHQYLSALEGALLVALESCSLCSV